MEKQNQSYQAIGLLVILSLIWGTSFILMKKGLAVFLPGQVGAIRVSAAAIVLLPFALTRFREIPSSGRTKLFLSGMMGIFIPAFLFATAQRHMESAITGILNSLTPIFTLLVGVLLFQQRIQLRSVLGIVIGFAGSLMLILYHAGGSLSGINLFAILIIIACMCYGFNVNFVKFKLTGISALTLTSVALMMIGPFALIYLFGFTDFLTRMQAPGAWTALGFLVLLGTMSTSVATILFNKLIKISTPLFASSSTYLIPIVAVFWGILDKEVLGIGHLAGMMTIIAGVYLANRK